MLFRSHTSNLVKRPPPPKGYSQKRPRGQYPRPFDPDELTRRLYIVLAEQKAHAEQKRRFKAETARSGTLARPPANAQEKSRRRVTLMEDAPRRKDSHAAGHGSGERPKRSSSRKTKEADVPAPHTEVFGPDGHYIPQVAAAQFARTTLGDAASEQDKSLVHKLSRKAMKYHMQGSNVAREVTDAPPCEQAKALRRAQSTRERNYERNQFQHPGSLHPLDEAAAFDGPVVDEKQLKASRRKSTGSFLGRSDPVRHSSELPPIMSVLEKEEGYDHCEVVGDPDEHRVDWSQRDEANRQPTSESPTLRKPESR